MFSYADFLAKSTIGWISSISFPQNLSNHKGRPSVPLRRTAETTNSWRAHKAAETGEGNGQRHEAIRAAKLV